MKTSHLIMISRNHLNEITYIHTSSEMSHETDYDVSKTVSPGRFFLRHPWSSLTCSDVGGPVRIIIMKTSRLTMITSNHLNEWNLSFFYCLSARHYIATDVLWSLSKKKNLQAQLFGNFSWDWLRCFKKLFRRVDSSCRHLWSSLACSDAGA